MCIYRLSDFGVIWCILVQCPWRPWMIMLNDSEWGFRQHCDKHTAWSSSMLQIRRHFPLCWADKTQVRMFCSQSLDLVGHFKDGGGIGELTSLNLYFVSTRERTLRQRVFRRKTLVITRTTCVFSHAFKKEHQDWRLQRVFLFMISVTSRSFSGWDQV